uniref:Single domain-containing protein n=1 Tax=Timema bartmani TaxID=61472 RepID=A0A7R9EVD1_9NEOP|nr:unnamed protein product [Timema bartmani]
MIISEYKDIERLCGLRVGVLRYGSEGSGFDPRRFPDCSVKQWVWNGVNSALCSKMHIQSPCKVMPGNFALQFPECCPTVKCSKVHKSPKTLNEFDSTKIIYPAPKVKLADVSTPPQATAAKT